MRSFALAASLALAVALPFPATVPPASQGFPAQAPQSARHRGGRALPEPTTAPGQSARRRRRLARHGKTVWPMSPFLRRTNRAFFALILATEDELLRANGYLPTGHLGVTGDPDYRSPEGFTCSRTSALVIIAEATLGSGEGGRGSAEQRGADHQEHRDHQGDAVHALNVARADAAGELAS